MGNPASPGEHRTFALQLLEQADLELRNAERADSCSATVYNVIHASYLVGQAKRDAGLSGNAEVMNKVSRFVSTVDRTTLDLIERRCVRPISKTRRQR